MCHHQFITCTLVDRWSVKKRLKHHNLWLKSFCHRITEMKWFLAVVALTLEVLAIDGPEKISENVNVIYT